MVIKEMTIRSGNVEKIFLEEVAFEPSLEP